MPFTPNPHGRRQAGTSPCACLALINDNNTAFMTISVKTMNSKTSSSVLYDTAPPPNAYDPFQSPIDHIDRPPSAQTFKPRCFDLDDPGPSSQLPLSYDDGIPSFGPMHEVLIRKKAAEQRSSEAEELFAPIAKTFDQHLASFPHIQGRKAYALDRFREELLEVAAKHFDAYIRGTLIPSIPYSTVQEETASSSTRSEKIPGKFYANAVKSNGPKPLMNKKSNIPKTPKNQPDDRLFLRLSNDDPLRAYSGFALLDYIKSKLGLDKELIKNVLPTKTGFALSPSKGNLKALEEKISEN